MQKLCLFLVQFGIFQLLLTHLRKKFQTQTVNCRLLSNFSNSLNKQRFLTLQISMTNYVQRFLELLLLFISKDWKDSKISKTKVFSLVYQYLISQMELGPAELGGRGGHIIPLIPSIQAVIEKRNSNRNRHSL